MVLDSQNIGKVHLVPRLGLCLIFDARAASTLLPGNGKDTGLMLIISIPRNLLCIIHNQTRCISSGPSRKQCGSKNVMPMLAS